MKLLDVISEESAILKAMGHALFGRTFKSAAEEIIYRKATADLAEAIYQARRTGRDFGTKESWDIVKPYVQNTAYARDKELIQSIYDDSFKAADKRIKAELKDARKGQVTSQGAINPEILGISKKAKVISASIAATGLYIGLAGEEGSPLDDYFKRMEWAEYKFSIGPNPDPKNPGQRGFTKEEFDKYHSEEMGILIGRMAALIPVITVAGIGGKTIQWILNLIGVSASSTAILGATAKMAAFTMFAHSLNKDVKIVKAGGKSYNAKECITLLMLSDKFGWSDRTWAETIGSSVLFAKDVLVGLWDVAIDSAKNYNDPNFKPKADQAPKVQQTSGDASEWKQTPSGYWQNTKTKAMLSPHEYEEKFGG